MIVAASAMALSLTAQAPVTLTLMHGDEHVVSWLDRVSLQGTGDRIRSRTLRVRHSDQAFWLVQEIDCGADTIGLVAAVNVEDASSGPPSLQGETRHTPIRRHDRFSRALRDAVCEGTYVETGVRPVRGAAAAVAALDTARAAAVRARPLELVVVHGGKTPVLLDRATLEGGGPQWEVRSLKVSGMTGLWSFWEFDCTGTGQMAADLRWTAPMTRDGGYGERADDREAAGPVEAGSERAAVRDAACAADIWERPTYSSREAAVRAARANPR